ncbi:MAG: TetR/AcrR family transcriptional regulator [Acidobacteriota bacterium]|nr:TetR/AcrR family transcriptional regulator [Acidobacteriota bacterium]
MTPDLSTNANQANAPIKRPYLRADARRQQLLDVALALVDRVGLGQLTISQLAVEAGVTRQTAYHHFADVNDLVRSILRARFAHLQVAINEVLERDGQDPAAAVRAAITISVDLPLRDRRLLRYVFGGLESERPELRETVRTLRGLVTLRWCRVVYGPQPVPARTSAAVWATFNALLGVYDLLDADEITRDDAIETVYSFATRLPPFAPAP